LPFAVASRVATFFAPYSLLLTPYHLLLLLSLSGRACLFARHPSSNVIQAQLKGHCPFADDVDADTPSEAIDINFALANP